MISYYKHSALCTYSLLFSFALLGCSSTPKENKSIDLLLKSDVGSIDGDLAERMMKEPVSYKSKARQKIEGQIQQKVWWWINYYTTRDRERFQRSIDRGEYYRPLVQQVLSEHRLPTELYYLAMIESGFVSHAESNASAVGIWQFMRPTAIHYGLGVNNSFDERRDPVAATHAAARFLGDLQQQLNSWYLTISAYNAGRGRVNKAIRMGKTRDFWELAAGGYLPKETMDYIPKFLATITIANHLEKFGFREAILFRKQKNWPKLAQIRLKNKTSISAIAAKAELSEAELLQMNPQLKILLKKSQSQKIKVWVPKSTAEKFSEKIYSNKVSES